jgi:hypothetical protein
VCKAAIKEEPKKKEVKYWSKKIGIVSNRNPDFDIITFKPVCQDDTTATSSGSMETHVITGVCISKVNRTALKFLKRSMEAPSDVVYLTWEKCIECPGCARDSKGGGILVTEIMFRRVAATRMIKMRAMPRIWHQECVSKIVTDLNYDSFVEDSLDNVWEITLQDAEKVQTIMAKVVNMFSNQER